MINIVKSEWITANAGSGKTTALTDRVVKLLLLGVAPEHIICITYTKAAASEMRERVLKKLRELLLADEAACKARIETLLDTVASPELIARARSLFGQLLDSPTGGLQLTTIHGFCQNLLRRFPMEAGIAPHFTVLEDAAADELLARTKNRLLGGLDTGDRWLNGAVALISARGGEFRFDELVDHIIKQRRMWETIWRAQSPESLRLHLFALHGLEEGLSDEVLVQAFCEGISAADEATICQHLPALCAHKTKSYRELGEGLAAWFERDVTARALAIQAMIGNFVKADGARYKTLLNKKEYPPEHALSEALERIGELALRYSQRVAALHCAEESFAPAILAKTLLDLYDQAKAATHALDYDDLIAHTLRLVSNPETLGWVMSKLDHRIDHLLIDEAQDNSTPQWQLAKVLVEELIATNGGIGNAGLPRSLLVVGDEKQSIYSFQGAAPEQFQHYRTEFRERLEELVDRVLSNSYRSAEAVLRLVDRICTQPEMAASLSAIGHIEEHRLIREHAAGRVVLYPPVVPPAKQETPALTIPLAYHIASSAPQLLAERIADTVGGWLQNQRLLESEGRPIRAGDILILVKNRTTIVGPLIRALQRRKVPVAGIDRLVLAEHLAVRDLLALMRWCANIGDDLALAQVLRSPLIGMSDEELRAHAHGRADGLWAEISNPWLAEMRRWCECPPYEFLTQVLEVSGKRRAFARRFGEEVHEVLDELKAQAASMPAGMQPTLTQFHAWIAGSARSIKREQETGEADHVRIMTVHGAKGLEAPVVLLADTVSVPTTQRERIFPIVSPHQQLLPVLAMSDAAKQAPRLNAAKDAKKRKLLDEYARLLYVALTRARDELHVFGIAGAKGEVKQGSWYQAVADAMRAMEATRVDDALELRDMREAVAPKPAAALAATALLPAWAVQPPAPEEEVNERTLAPSSLAPAQASPYQQRAATGAKERGVRIHRVLELLRADSTPESIARLVGHVAPDWDESTRATVIREVTALVDAEPWLWQYPRSPEANIAGSISHQGARIPVSGQIDLLVETPGEIIILDYKTGAHVPQTAAEVSLNYLLQLKIYAELVRQLYPDKRVRTGILWTSTAQLMWLDEAVQNAAFPDKDVMLIRPVAA